jgi:glycosyltransferase involved in cell wall biosynthesis
MNMNPAAPQETAQRGQPGEDVPASSLLTDSDQPPSGCSAGSDRLVEVTIPVYNEERILAENIRRLDAFLSAHFPFRFLITIADNGSTDDTYHIAQQLSAELRGVRAVHLDRKGRGWALRQVWGSSQADVVAYMDADLSTGLDAFLPLVAPLVSRHSDLATGTRLARGATVERGLKREITSRSYNLLLRAFLSARVSDAQCGFKAGRTEVIRALLPDIEDNRWFFDTELLMLAQRRGLRVTEVPVTWVEDPDSKVAIAATALSFLRGMARLRFRPAGRGAGTESRPADAELTTPEQHR